ncbi:hypothetical protein HanPSC8_Chr01g0036671 [Helianthus annuus]|nr:hypothetical protein HanIR_Chr01g0041991 [Helianthus annuus]KAJ0958229.1 hypothetical protein HanPSC8_Chr01g0036671 [Helianthus annuus]
MIVVSRFHFHWRATIYIVVGSLVACVLTHSRLTKTSLLTIASAASSSNPSHLQ